jgi:hypothetical protein
MNETIPESLPWNRALTGMKVRQIHKIEDLVRQNPAWRIVRVTKNHNQIRDEQERKKLALPVDWKEYRAHDARGQARVHLAVRDANRFHRSVPVQY